MAAGGFADRGAIGRVRRGRGVKPRAAWRRGHAPRRSDVSAGRLALITRGRQARSCGIRCRSPFDPHAGLRVATFEPAAG